MIAGKAATALKIYKTMVQKRIKPDEETFIRLISAIEEVNQLEQLNEVLQVVFF